MYVKVLTNRCRLRILFPSPDSIALILLTCKMASGASPPRTSSSGCRCPYQLPGERFLCTQYSEAHGADQAVPLTLVRPAEGPPSRFLYELKSSHFRRGQSTLPWLQGVLRPALGPVSVSRPERKECVLLYRQKDLRTSLNCR